MARKEGSIDRPSKRLAQRKTINERKVDLLVEEDPNVAVVVDLEENVEDAARRRVTRRVTQQPTVLSKVQLRQRATPKQTRKGPPSQSNPSQSNLSQ